MYKRGTNRKTEVGREREEKGERGGVEQGELKGHKTVTQTGRKEDKKDKEKRRKDVICKEERGR